MFSKHSDFCYIVGEIASKLVITICQLKLHETLSTTDGVKWLTEMTSTTLISAQKPTASFLSCDPPHLLQHCNNDYSNVIWTQHNLCAIHVLQNSIGNVFAEQIVCTDATVVTCTYMYTPKYI